MSRVKSTFSALKKKVQLEGEESLTALIAAARAPAPVASAAAAPAPVASAAAELKVGLDAEEEDERDDIEDEGGEGVHEQLLSVLENMEGEDTDDEEGAVAE